MDELVGQFSSTEPLTVGNKTVFVPKTLIAEKVSVGGIPNQLEKSQIFTTQNRTANLEARPTVIHFGGFLLQHTHEQTLKIVNISGRAQRIHILQPQTSFFTFKSENMGKIPPGLAQSVKIVFTPDEWRYYYDCLRVHAEGENLLIPIHAYPVVNVVEFPPTLDLGRITLHETVRRVLLLGCSVPIEFDFLIDLLDPSPFLKVRPLAGTIPANGQVEIVVEFLAARAVTFRSRMKLHISQYNWKPMTCELVASGVLPSTQVSDLTSKSLLFTENILTTSSIDINDDNNNNNDSSKYVTSNNNGNSATFTISSPKSKKMTTTQFQMTVTDRLNGRTKGSSNNNTTNNNNTNTSSSPSKRLNQSSSTVGTTGMTTQNAEEIIDGIRVPADPFTQHAARYILNQDPGKLSIADMKAMLADDAGGGDGGGGGGTDPKEKARMAVEAHDTRDGLFRDCDEEWGEQLSQQRAQVFFEREARLNAEYEKAKDIKWFVAVGEVPPTVEEVNDVLMRRDLRKLNAERQQRETERQKLGVVMEETKVMHQVEGLDHKPTFDPYLNDAWRIRKQALSGFVDVMRLVIVRQRVDRRIALLQTVVANMNPQQLAAALSPPGSGYQAVRDAGGENKLRVKDSITVDTITPNIFPLYLDDNFRDRKEVQAGDVEPFQDWDVFELKVGQQYKLLGYEAHMLPAQPCYVSFEKDRHLRAGAEEEEGLRGPRGPTNKLDVAELTQQRMPSVCSTYSTRIWQHHPCPHLQKNRAVVQAPFVPMQPTDVSYCLESAPPHPSLSKLDAVGAACSAVLATAATDTICGLFLPNRELPDCVMGPIPKMLDYPLAEDMASYAMDDDDEDENAKANPVVPKAPKLDAIRQQFQIPMVPGAGGPRAAFQHRLWERETEMKATRANILKEKIHKLNQLIVNPKSAFSIH